MARVRRVDCSETGITRRKRGKGFEYRRPDGELVKDAAELDRIAELAIPPAWRDVWICSNPLGHIQATGTDAAGRKQYRYHVKWRERRDQQKFDEMLDFARALPAMREVVDTHLAEDGLTRARVLACAVRLLDRGFFRVGGEDYAVTNETYGLATIQKRHVKVDGDEITFDYPAKSGRQRVLRLIDPDVAGIVGQLKRRRGGSTELLAHRGARGWTDIRSDDINAYVKEVTGGDYSAKDFRTWNATVLAAVALAVSGPAAVGSRTARKRAMTRAIKEVAHYLGNTPAVARASYIDPRVFDRYQSGLTIAPALAALGDEAGLGEFSLQGGVEQAVIDLIGGDDTELVERVEESPELTGQAPAPPPRPPARPARRRARPRARRSPTGASRTSLSR